MCRFGDAGSGWRTDLGMPGVLMDRHSSAGNAGVRIRRQGDFLAPAVRLASTCSRIRRAGGLPCAYLLSERKLLLMTVEAVSAVLLLVLVDDGEAAAVDFLNHADRDECLRVNVEDEFFYAVHVG